MDSVESIETLVELKNRLKERNVNVLELKLIIVHLKEINDIINQIRQEIGYNSQVNLRAQDR